MSADMVDDLEGAEDMAASLAHVLLNVPAHGEWETRRREVLHEWETYCRATCGYRVDGACADGEFCGCPCGHVEPEVSAS